MAQSIDQRNAKHTINMGSVFGKPEKVDSDGGDDGRFVGEL